jgi:hypothetical protein
MGFIMLPLGIWQFFRLTRWKKRNSLIFREYLEMIKQANPLVMPSILMEKIEKSPQKLPSNLWKNFKGERLMIGNTVDFDFDSWPQAIGVSLFLLFVGVLAAVYIFSTLADIFPNLASLLQ